MFPMLGPPRENKNKKKKKPSKTVRLVEPTQEESIASSAASNRAIYHYQTSSPPLPPIPPHKLPSPSNSSINPETLFPQTLIVISFITRLPLKRNQGQGTEILFYKPKTTLNPSESHHCAFKCIPKHGPGTGSKWTFLFIDGGPIEEVTAEQLSLRSIKRHLSPPDDRLVKVRTSKALRWDNDTLLVSVLYRLKEIDRKKDEEWIKMDVESHYWSKIYGFHAAIENELVSTALAAVSFPVAFNVGFEEIAQHDPLTRSDVVTLKALETLYLSVQAGYARDGFKFYPQTAEPLKKVGNTDRDFKRRIWAYWTEVLCWHLIECRAVYKVSISYAINKILAVLKPDVRNDKVNVEELEKRMVGAIGVEADRCQQSIENIVKHAVFEILHVPDHYPLINTITSIHLFTLGSSSATYEALSQLVKYFMTQSRWRLGLTNEGAIEGLKITIAENRPLHEGVILASKLNELINVYQAPRPIPPKADNARSLKHVPSLRALDTLLDSKDWYLDADHQKVLDSFEDCHPAPLTGLFANTPVIGQDGDDRGHLGDLLERVNISNNFQLGDHNQGESDNIKVQVEVTTDVGLRSCLLNAGPAGVLLLAADRVLPNGDALCKLGSTSAAYTAHKLGQIVIILVRHDRVHPSHEPHPPEPTTPTSVMSTSQQAVVSGMIESWKRIFKHEIIDQLSRKVLVGGSEVLPPATATGSDIPHPLAGFEVVKAQWISCFITDSGKMGLERVQEVAETLSSLHHLLWEENDHNQP
ncbi:hypothetical protein PGT21_005532 [Puccinia graminis f. sp. tritici]|uniref:Uncharacterized protein n=1 Tax=Puccinia graminis f. sp. tritici TaxID=56615 RepID=A0A5B0N2T3_PUCGR|nr:hypothetical protein PGTUg99_035617 [Puccinia graminis f. sp. tritici]KAA1093994.1 hypothetical protein PGT21_005532 [Puccinia graminis f. sp. tritici]